MCRNPRHAISLGVGGSFAISSDDMQMLPSKRKRPRSGIERAPRRIYQTHRQFVRRHGCCVPNCQGLPIEFAHAKTRGSGGHDASGVSLCLVHHHEQHTLGIETFQAKYKVDLFALATEFARKTTDKALRLALQEDPSILNMGRLAERERA